MVGETNLSTLLSNMSPELQPAEYVFCTVKAAGAELNKYLGLQPLASFMEAEGLTLVIEKSVAQAENLAYESVFKCITLKVHSSLDAVGLTAAVAGKLAEYGISANVMAAYYHDHIFVQTDKAGAAMQALQRFTV